MFHISHIFCLKMVKEQKGRLEEISKSKQEMQLSFKVDDALLYCGRLVLCFMM